MYGKIRVQSHLVAINREIQPTPLIFYFLKLRSDKGGLSGHQAKHEKSTYRRFGKDNRMQRLLPYLRNHHVKFEIDRVILTCINQRLELFVTDMDQL